MSSELGRLFILSGASGTGKTTLARRLVDELQLFFSTSATTRPPRAGEVEGRDYYFLTLEEFRKRESGGHFLETAQVHGHWYGTPREPIERRIAEGKDALLDLDTQGGLRLKAEDPRAVLIFLMPPSLEVLPERLKGRGTDTEEVIASRVKRAEDEIAQSRFYDHTVVNSDLETAGAELKGIIRSYKDS